MRLNPFAVWGSLALALALSVSTWASGQTTQPVATPTTSDLAASWQQVVERLAEQLAGQDLTALRSSLSGAAPVIRNFSSDSATSIERLLASTTQAKLLGAHAYAKVPATLATDLANDFQNAGDIVPEQVKKDMAPRDASAERRANDTAASWVMQVLQPRKDQPVGVIVFWPTDRRLPTDTSARRAIFVLIKGQLSGEQFVIQQITFGDPLETPR